MVTEDPKPGTLGYKLRTRVWNSLYRWSKQLLEGHGHSGIRSKWILRGDLLPITDIRNIIRDAIIPTDDDETSS